MYNEEQSYNTKSTSFNIPCSSLSPSLSYNYNLLVLHSDRTVASYTGLLASTITTITISVLPSCTDNTVTSFSHGTVTMILMFINTYRILLNIYFAVSPSCTLTTITTSAESTNSKCILYEVLEVAEL